MKKLLLGVLFIVLVVGCGTKPETVVTKFIDKVKEKKFEEASKYALNDELKNDVSLSYNNTVQQLLFEKLFSNMKYEVVGSEKKGNNETVVTVSVENVDTKKVFLNIFKKMFQSAFSDSGEELNIEEEFKKILNSEDVPKVKNITKFLVIKTKEGNKISVTAENVDILFGNLNSTLSNLDKLGEEEVGENSSANGSNTDVTNTSENQNKDNKIEQKEEGPKAGTDQKLTEPTLNKNR